MIKNFEDSMQVDDKFDNHVKEISIELNDSSN